jgi:hypothetical protein
MPNRSYSELLKDHFSFTGRGEITDKLFKTLIKLGIADEEQFWVGFGDGVLSMNAIEAMIASAPPSPEPYNEPLILDPLFKTDEDQE